MQPLRFPHLPNVSKLSNAPERHAILSLGAGVQSTTLALMARRGELPLPEAAIFADTGWESAATYAHLAWLTAELQPVLPVHVVRKRRPDGSLANIRDDTLAVVTGRQPRVATAPLYVRASHEYNPSPRPEIQARFERAAHGRANFVVLPLYARHFTGRVGMLRRQCTGEFKLAAIFQKSRELIGRRPGTRRTQPPYAEMWIGISADEKATRCKSSTEPWITNRYPLRELGMTRRDCEAWLWTHYRRRVPKSSCIGCPYHDDRLWREMKRERPDEWAEAVAFDKAIRRLPMVQGECFLHRSCVPLDEVDLRTPEERGQLSFGAALLGSPDEGDWCQP